MPNGGSDCCGTCWFNTKNKGQTGYEHSNDPEPARCAIRGFLIENPFYTYCANHPYRRPSRDPVPIGPVYIFDSSGGREVWKPSPDTEVIRLHLLGLLREQVSILAGEYPIGHSLGEVVVWQLGEFKESRAASDLKRLSGFDFKSRIRSLFQRQKNEFTEPARVALSKLRVNKCE